MIKHVRNFEYKGYRCMITEVSYPQTFIDSLKFLPDMAGRLSWYCGYIEIPFSEEERYENTVRLGFVEKNLRAVADFITGKEMR